MRIFLECLVHTRLGSFNIPSKCGPLTFSILSWQDARASLEVGSAFLCSFGHLPAAASQSRVQSEHTCSGRSSCSTYALQLQAVIIFFKTPRFSEDVVFFLPNAILTSAIQAEDGKLALLIKPKISCGCASGCSNQPKRHREFVHSVQVESSFGYLDMPSSPPRLTSLDARERSTVYSYACRACVGSACN